MNDNKCPATSKHRVQRDSWPSQDKEDHQHTQFQYKHFTVSKWRHFCKLMKHKKSQCLYTKKENTRYYRMIAKWYHDKNSEHVWNGWMHCVNWYFSFGIDCVSIWLALVPWKWIIDGSVDVVMSYVLSLSGARVRTLWTSPVRLAICFSIASIRSLLTRQTENV